MAPYSTQHSRSEFGFTLLELLIVIVLMGMVIAAATQIFESTRRTFTRQRPDSGRELAAQVFLDRFERELHGVVMLKKPEGGERLDFPWLFVSESKLFDSNESDNIKFITQTPARSPGRDAEGLRVVSYGIESARDIERYDLYRLEEPIKTRMEKEVRVYDGDPVIEDVARFKLTFNTAGQGQKRESWDSTQIEMLDDIPYSVEAALTLYEDFDGELVEGQEFTRTVTLHVRPFEPPEDDDEGSCEDGVSISQCVRQIVDEYQPNESTTDELWRLSDEAGEGCWLPESGGSAGPTLERLHREAKRLTGAEVEELCLSP